jgi:hypothetical protein
MNTKEKALLLVAAVRKALKDGIKHYDKNGRLLKTDREILEALQRDGSIQFELPPGTKLPDYD